MLKCKNSRASRNYELLLGFRPGSLLFLRGRLFRCLLFGGGFLFRFQFCFCFCFFLGSRSGSWRSRPGWFFGSGFGPRFSRRLDHRLGGIFLPGARVVRRLVVVAKEIVFSAHSHLLVQEAAPSSGLFVRDIIPLLYGSAMRERQYSFLFRGNRPSTPIAGNTAHDFARSCRKLDLSELVFGDFPCRNYRCEHLRADVQEFGAVEKREYLKSRVASCELELLYGYPWRPLLKIAWELAIPTRLYVPYGGGGLPYRLKEGARRRAILGWFLRDLWRGSAGALGGYFPFHY